MKIAAFPRDLKNELQLNREEISSMLSALQKAGATLNKLTSREAALQEEISALESASPDDKGAIANLSEKRTELELVRRRIEEAPAPDSIEEEQTLRQLLHSATQLVRRAMTPTYERYIGEIASHIRPFCANDDQAKQIAKQTQAAGYLWQAACPDYGRYGAVLPNARLVLKRYDEIQAGEFAWEFQPAIS